MRAALAGSQDLGLREGWSPKEQHKGWVLVRQKLDVPPPPLRLLV